MNIFGFKSRRVPARYDGVRPSPSGEHSLAFPVDGSTQPFPATKAAMPQRHFGWQNDIFSSGGAGVARSYAEQVRAAYATNPVAQRSCRVVAEAVSGAPLIAEDSALVQLLTERAGGQVLLEAVATHLLLHGNAYVQIVEGAQEHPAELYALRPDRMTVEMDANGWPSAFNYKVGGQGRRLPTCDAQGRATIIHIRTTNPLDDHYGLGCLSAAAQAVAIHNAAGDWNRALLANAARPSGALIYEAGQAGSTLSATQFERLRDEMEAQFQGAGNAGRPMLLEGGLKWQPISMTPAEMDFHRLKDSAARDIAMAFGVPPMLIGIPGDATYANYREASKALWRLTVLPMANAILASIGQGLATWGMATRLKVALDQVPALSEDRERLWTQVSGADFLSVDEKRAMLGLAAREDAA